MIDDQKEELSKPFLISEATNHDKSVIELWTKGAPHLMTVLYDKNYASSIECTVNQVKTRHPGVYSFKLVQD